MIDDQQEVQALMEEMTRQLPLQVFATPALATLLQKQGIRINTDEPLPISAVHYLGDEGGISCGFEGERGNVTVVSITHLRFEDKGPLGVRIRSYQAMRTRRIDPANHRPSRTQLAAKLKQYRSAQRRI